MDKQQQQEQKKKLFAGALLAVAVGVGVYQALFAGGSGVTPAPKSGATQAKGGAAAPAKSGAAAPAAKSGAAEAGPTRLVEVDVNIDELLRGVEEVTFNYETMRIDRDPLAALVGGPLKQDAAGDGAVITATGPMEVLRKKITGIIYDEYDPVAVVDDDVVHVGHQYPNGVKVHAIERDKVIFQLGDALIPVEMKEQ